MTGWGQTLFRLLDFCLLGRKPTELSGRPIVVEVCPVYRYGRKAAVCQALIKHTDRRDVSEDSEASPTYLRLWFQVFDLAPAERLVCAGVNPSGPRLCVVAETHQVDQQLN